MPRKRDSLLPNQMKAARYALGLSQEQLAKKAGVHSQSVKRWEIRDGTGLDHNRASGMHRILAFYRHAGIEIQRRAITIPDSVTRPEKQTEAQFHSVRE